MSRSDIQAGGAFVRLFLKDDLQKQLTGAMRKAGETIGKAGRSLTAAGVKIAAVGGALSAPFLYAISAASRLEETMSKFGVVFGDRANDVKAWGNELAKQIGRSENEIMGFLAGAQDLFVPLGFAADAAESMSKQVTQLTYDLASFNNMADADVMRDLQAALTGSGEVMKKYGVIVSEAAVKQELLNQGLDPKNATDQQKVQARLNIIMRGTTAAQGDALRTSAGFANQMKALRAAIDDTAAEIGTALLPHVTKIVGQFRSAVAIIRQFARGNGQLIVAVAASVAGITALGIAISGVGAIMAGVGIALSGAAGAVSILLSPVGLLTTAIIAGTAAWIRYTDSGKRAWQGLLNAVLPMAETFKGTFAGIADALKSGDIQLAGEILMVGLELAVRQGVEQLKSIFGETFGVIANQILSGDLSGAWATVVDSMLVHWQGFKVAVLEVFAGIVISVSKMWTGLQNKISKWLIDLSQNSTFRGALAGAGIGVAGRAGMASLLGIDPNAMSLDMAEDAKRIIDEATRATQHGIEQSWLATVEQARQVARDLQQAQQEAVSTGSDEAASRVAELEQRLAALREQAATVATGIAGAAVAGDAMAGVDASVAANRGGIGNISGMFRASAIAAAGRGASPEQKSLEELKALRREAREQRIATERLALATERHYLAMTHS